MKPFSWYVPVAVLAILLAASERQVNVVKPTGVTTFDARVVGWSWSPAKQCDGRERACTRAKIVVTNVGAGEGDSMCSVRMLDAQGQQLTVVGLPIASNLAPGESTSWDVDFRGGPGSARSRCPAYDPARSRTLAEPSVKFARRPSTVR